MAEETLLAGRVSIGRPHGLGADYISIDVEDVLSGTRAIEVRVPYARFAEALTGLSSVECTFLPSSPRVGKVREHKTVRVAVSEFLPDDDEIDSIVATLEVDGWQARRGDLRNPHNHTSITSVDGVRLHYYKVTCVRWVDAKQAPPQEK